MMEVEMPSNFIKCQVMRDIFWSDCTQCISHEVAGSGNHQNRESERVTGDDFLNISTK